MPEKKDSSKSKMCNIYTYKLYGLVMKLMTFSHTLK